MSVYFSGDIHRLQQGLETQYYDAFLLYAEEDIDFVNEMVEKLETEFKLKVLHINEMYDFFLKNSAIIKLYYCF